jgi:hypothetical protein
MGIAKRIQTSERQKVAGANKTKRGRAEIKQKEGGRK